jgi:uncharacterized membrane protein
VPPLAVSTYDLSIFIHVTAVVVGFGATFAESLTFPIAMRLDPRHLPYVHRLHMAINQRLATPALAVVLITGIYQAADGPYDFSEAWISASFVIVLLLGALLGAYLVPADRRLAAMAEAELADAGAGAVTLSDEYQRRARDTARAGAAAGVLVVIAIFLMVAKPGA